MISRQRFNYSLETDSTSQQAFRSLLNANNSLLDCCKLILTKDLTGEMFTNMSFLPFTETSIQTSFRTPCYFETMRKMSSKSLFWTNRMQTSKWSLSSQRNSTIDNSKQKLLLRNKLLLNKMISIILKPFRKIIRYSSSTTVTLRRLPCSWCMMFESWEIFPKWKMSFMKKQIILCMLDVCYWPKECWSIKTA